MNVPGFAPLDWAVVGVYFAVMLAAGFFFMPGKTSDAKEYFLAGGQLPSWLAAVSVLSATMSAATFLGAPDYGYRSDFTYLSTNIAAVLAAFIVARLLIPRYYARGVTTVYELLEGRFGTSAMRAAGALFLVGRVLASGARVYLGAIAISMIMFGTIGAPELVVGAFVLVAVSFAFTFVGGLKSVVWNDLVQFVIYVGAAVGILIFLWLLIPAPASEIIATLRATPEGLDKLRLFEFSVDLSRPFSMVAVLTGFVLLNVGNSGLDQDTTQRLLACKDAKSGARGLIMAQLMCVPIVAVFIAIGVLLWAFYQSPTLMQRSDTLELASTFQGLKIGVFMHFILTHIPSGLRGLATVGVIASAVSTTNSAMNAMSSVLIEDFYRPWRAGRALAEEHFVRAGRVGMALTGVGMFAVAVLSYFWQRYADVPMLEFVLAAQTFSYAGLLGVYMAALFTRRGAGWSAIAALAAGFLTILLLQGYVIELLHLPEALKRLAFPWQLCIGTLVAFLTCVAGSTPGGLHGDN